MGIVGSVMVPHPPLILPEVGRGEESVIAETAAGYLKAAEFVAALQPETIILSSPHSMMYADYLHISPGERAVGNMSHFGAPQVEISRTYDNELSALLCENAQKAGISAGYLGERDPSLDHGTMVPLYFILQKYTDFKLVRIGLSGLSLAEHYRFGQLIQTAADQLNRRVVYVASGDLSHKLKESGPYGYDPHGPVYDQKIMDSMGRAAFGELLTFDPVLCDKAAECGHRSFTIMGGALDGKAVEVNRLCYQDVTGVGYGICTYRVTGEDRFRSFLSDYLMQEQQRLQKQKENEDAYVALARNVIVHYIGKGIQITMPSDLPAEMYHVRAGVFVSLHIRGALRGCIGTIAPTRECVAQEIMENAISAATGDPRFEPLREEELEQLEYSVDVLGEAEDIEDLSQLNVKEYGVIVSADSRRGLLLPDLDGVDNVEEQVHIARQKAGIRDNEPVKLQRFKVTRHY
ncbi:MAG: AmmeMemoRadiSam system protein A [Butyrivibrio sp.]|nr:AmmeMemoRadiSam system protein A [Butyrivibrio sp.]